MSNHVSALRRRIAVGAAVVTAAGGGVLVAQPAQAISADVVISEVYGGGGNTGATFTNDFIELYNRGSTTVDVSEWSVQYGSSTGSSSMSGTSRKVALVTNQTALPCGADCDTNAAVRDFVGYGSANDFEAAPTTTRRT